ncbi:MAG TPA: NAD(P)/FAD-dependent oxidoreductase [Dehalococcoidia bacterium]|nr:NAD(P)/FAD-dependent oxidoreductase [Dehalococcoidia bacterium]
MAKARTLKTKYLIIGNSAGGIGAAEAIREVDKAGSITIVSDEPYHCYSRPLIAKYLTGERTFEGMLFRPLDFYEQNAIDARLGHTVTGLGLDKRTAALESGERITWERLLIASGGVPIVPDTTGLDKRGVFNFISLDDARAISELVDSATKAVVIGGGLIGISATEALSKRGLEVTVVEMKDRILNTILDEEASRMAAETLENAGIRVITDNTVAEIMGKDWVSSVVLSDGEEIPCSLLVVAIGVLPRIDLVQGADIKVNRGIVVDRTMATNYPDVYACGDVSEAYDFVLDTNRLTPIWPNAHIGGRVAGYNMAGVRTEYPGGTAMNSLNYFGLDIAAAGIATPPEKNVYECVSRREDGTYKKLVMKDDIILGMVCIGDIEKSGILYSLMKDRVNVRKFKGALLADNFGLVSLPRRLWRERLGAPQPEQVVELPEEEEMEDVMDE